MSDLNQAGIYQILSKHNNKRYVGSTYLLTKRINEHKRRLKNNKHENQHLQNHYNKYGKDDLVYSVLEFIQIDEIDKEQVKILILEREQYYLDTMNPEFNICKIAGSSLGTTRSEKSNLQVRGAQRGINSGKGISFDKARQMYKVSMRLLKTRIHLGYFKTYEAALEARIAAENDIWRADFDNLSSEEQILIIDKYSCSMQKRINKTFGVCLVSSSGKYRAWIPVLKKSIYLGDHSTYEQALHIRLEAEKLFWSKEYKSLPYSEQILIRDKFNYKDLS
jgi:group I intron endonuclease